MHSFKNWYQKIKFQTKVMVLVNGLILVIFLALSLYIHSIISQNIQDEVGKKALAVSTSISDSPLITEAFDQDDPSEIIQNYVQDIEKKIDAEFIVVGDQNEIRLSHPLPERIGEKMVGGDNERALKKGQSYISKSKGSIGLSIRGKTPIINHGEIVGVVSVGYLLDDINALILQKNKPIFILLIVFLIVGLIGSKLIASHLKHELHDMEPKEIATLLSQKAGILESVREGIIAVDTNNIITMINPSAQDILKIKGHILGRSIEDTLHFSLTAYAASGRIIQDEEYILQDETLLINAMPLMKDHAQYGAVMTFRRKTDLEKITQELTAVKQYSEGLRAQTHEFFNKIHTLYGLLQLSHYDEAEKFIQSLLKTTAGQPKLDQQIKDPIIQGLLIGKLNLASEKEIDFQIDEATSLEKINHEKIRHALLLALGNLIDNAFTALTSSPTPTVHLFMTDAGKNIMLEIEDNGPGIDSDILPQLFQDGATTKTAQGHGKGLFLLKKTLDKINGDIVVQASDQDGTSFMVIIPKEDKK